MTVDRYNRPIINLRIAITQQCNLECFYCHHEGQFLSSVNMTPEEIATIASISTEFGVRKLKITGGEPLLRSDLSEIILRLHQLPLIEEISIVTNGRILTLEKAKELKKNGLARVNISLPSTREDVYKRVTGASLNEATAGIDSAISAGLDPVKINTVVIRGINDSEIEQLIGYAERHGVILQLIELESVNGDEHSYLDYHYPLDEIEKKIAGIAKSVRTRRYMQARRVYTLDNAKVEIVKPIENTAFCMNCTRIRLTSDGMLKPCLMRNDNLVDILTPLRTHADHDELRATFSKAIALREPYWKPACLIPQSVQAEK
jgi:cyclic pyranopterin phosphate synthase